LCSASEILPDKFFILVNAPWVAIFSWTMSDKVFCIVQSELEYKKRADDEALRKKNIIYQLNADQEQRERIQEFDLDQ
jgi:hypothetical protein